MAADMTKNREGLGEWKQAEGICTYLKIRTYS